MYLQIIHRASFGPTRSWEFKGTSQSTTGQFQIDHGQRSQLTGKEIWTIDTQTSDKEGVIRVANVNAADVATHLNRLLDIRIPLITPAVPIGIADGNTYEVKLSGGIQATSHFVWRDGYPPRGWEPLQLVIDELIEKFPI